jgi:hypothetical protein
MNIIILKREILSNKATLGTLFTQSNRELCKTLELPFFDNKRNESCIPFGEYLVKKDDTGRHKYFKLFDVPNRENIEIHIANFTSEIIGCIACGQEWVFMRNEKTNKLELAVNYSKKTMDKLKEELPNEFKLKIIS